MNYSEAAIRRVTNLPDGIIDLAAVAAAEGHYMLDRLVAEWRSGDNRFNAAGEALFATGEGQWLAGVAGLNVDPFADELEQVGRVRRLYVHPTYRGRGVGTDLVQALERAAIGNFAKLTVFTPAVAGARFYEQRGFIRVKGRARRSHEKPLL